MMPTTSILLLVAAAMFLPSFAQAQVFNVPETRTVNIKVQFGDLDLDKPESARILYSRLEKAARKACEPVNISLYRSAVTPTAFEHDYKACIASAFADVVRRLNNPLVSGIYAEAHKVRSVDVASR